MAGEPEGGIELRDKLDAYLRTGGHLILTAANLAKMPGGLASIEINGGQISCAGGTQVSAAGGGVRETEDFELWSLSYPAEAEIVARVDGRAAVVRVPCGAGSLTVLASPFGVVPQRSTREAFAASQSDLERPLQSPYVLLNHVRLILDSAFRSQMLFEAGEGLSLITCRREEGEYTLGIANETWQQRPLKILSRCGKIESIRELELGQFEKTAAGYLPEGPADRCGRKRQTFHCRR